MFEHSLESSRRDDSNKWSNMGFSQEIDVLKIYYLEPLSGTMICDVNRKPAFNMEE